MSAWSIEAYEKAWQFAALAHKGQTYKGRTPDINYDYITHIGMVTTRVLQGLRATPEANADLALQCALLHDTLEDTPTTYEQLAAEFGRVVADGVLALSKNPDLPRPEQMKDSLARIVQQPKEVWMVKLADRADNLQYVPWNWTAERIANYKIEGQLILDTLKAANALLAQQLAERIKQYGQ
ncbi:MAG: HD domain-containing protein [Thiofilum sp.]|uniref:HD domain-containing protein n=1 Tax=Thiofilum sp. TaxID=2212733 RepID=UPI0025D481AD|nr:HD domain-containing protein [Thiofilum sp.]MBK8452610.1 bifunctional (p)ppGpp synthetase/guanosine-3',5'-bis(diphosphate) 3'-pyrophosphohydrolase [Thiofilum sp.]